MRALFWFRKDLRLEDNTGLHEAVRACGGDVVPFYASEPEMLSRPDIAPTRVRFVLECLADLGVAVESAGSRLVLDHGPAARTVLAAARRAGAEAVYWNDEYEPALRARDDAVARELAAAGIAVRRFHDRLLVPPGLVTRGDGRPYVVFGAFERACAAHPLAHPLPAVTRLAAHELPARAPASLERLGFTFPAAERWPGGTRAAARRLRSFVPAIGGYARDRDFPALAGTSRLSADLKFGTLSPRQAAAAALEAARAEPRMERGARKFVSELRWRDFFAHVLFHFPANEHQEFRAPFRGMGWPGSARHLEAWKAGVTGFPIVDAGMRELLATGYMHNRVRMIVASFLTKDLLLDWREGERHFMRHLVDGDLASNNGGWQWAASTGTDAQPFFRVFNPALQGARFDPDGRYVRRWIPALARLDPPALHDPGSAPPEVLAGAGVRLGADYPAPIVEHAAQRERAISLLRSRASIGREAQSSDISPF